MRYFSERRPFTLFPTSLVSDEKATHGRQRRPKARCESLSLHFASNEQNPYKHEAWGLHLTGRAKNQLSHSALACLLLESDERPITSVCACVGCVPSSWFLRLVAFCWYVRTGTADGRRKKLWGVETREVSGSCE